MPNKNYLKGRRKEYKLIKELISKGYDIAQRTAGSHSPIDIIAVHRDLQLISLVQSKPDDMRESEIEKLKEKYEWLNGKWVVIFEVK
jgi:Holliday junction resolvase